MTPAEVRARHAELLALRARRDAAQAAVEPAQKAYHATVARHRAELAAALQAKNIAEAAANACREAEYNLTRLAATHPALFVPGTNPPELR